MAEASEEGLVSQWAVVPMMMMIIKYNKYVHLKYWN
jgi:hypothetical protein